VAAIDRAGRGLRDISMPTEYLQFIDGSWRGGSAAASRSVIDPATENFLGTVRDASESDIDAALDAAATGFEAWRARSPFERAQVLRRAAEVLRERMNSVAANITREQGKPLREACTEILASADMLDWFAEEGRRASGRTVPGRQRSQVLQTRLEPIGPVAAFTPWNFPISQAARKVAASLAAGCSVVLKPSEEAPGGAVALVQALAHAGAPAGVINLVLGDPAAISRQLIASAIIRKVSFTGSVPVGKLLAAQAAVQMKPCTMELGGHAPVIVCEDADIAQAARSSVLLKFRNAGQACIAATRFFIHEDRYAAFRDAFVGATEALAIGAGSDPATDMGPLANRRRLQSMQMFVDDARAHGARVLIGGTQIRQRGYFFAPTILEHVGPKARILREEPFGPVAVLCAYRDLKQSLAEANALPYGLAAYAFTDSAARAEQIAAALDVGMISVNQAPIALPETPFGGVKESGYGREGGSEGLQPYLVTKLIASQYAAN
jgi:succinate-semialdehyde dehydrogenase / glutarate-semialdehyde dehydrogenase